MQSSRKLSASERGCRGVRAAKPLGFETDSLQPGEILGDTSDLVIGESPGYGAHDVRAVVAARAALEVGQLLHDVGLRLACKTRITCGACAVWQMTPDTSGHTRAAVALLIQCLARRR